MQTFHMYSYMKHNLLVLWTMASCVAKDLFYEKLEAMKSSKKGNSKLTVYIDDEFYQNAKNWLKNENTTHEEFGLTKMDVATIKRKLLYQERIFTVFYVKLTVLLHTEEGTKLRTL